MPAYLDNYVSASEIEELHALIDTESGYERRYGRWKTYASALRRRAAQQMWFHRIIGSDGDSPICACGLVLKAKSELVEMAWAEIDLGVEPFLHVRGHRNLPSQDGIATALIVDVSYQEFPAESLVSAYCQGCSKAVQGVALDEAQAFVLEHNQSCQR